MTWKRLLLATAAVAVPAWAAPAARGEDVSPTLTQDQANRLSLFHDYGLNAVGLDNYVGMPVNVGNPNDTGGLVAGSAGGGLLGGALPPSVVSTDPTGPGRPFDVTLAPFVGYDANPESRRIPRASVFAGGDLGVAYRFTDGPDDSIVGQPLRATFAYDAMGAVYEGQTENADALQQNLSASVRQTLFQNTIVLSSTLTDGYTVEHGDSFLNTFDAGATGEVFFLPQVSVESGFGFTNFEYFFKAILPPQRPSADRDTFIAKAHLYPLSQRRGATIEEAPDVLTEVLRAAIRRVTVNYDHVWNRPTERTGGDYQYEANRVGLGLEGLTVPEKVGVRSLGTFGRSLSMDLDYNHEFQNYEYANSASPPILAGHPKGGFHRKDGIDVLTFRGNARLFDLPHDAGTLGAFVQWDVIHDGSNIKARHYNDYVISGGVTYRY